MKFRALLIVAIASVLIVSTSCIPEFKNPLPRSKDMTPDRAILGTWETLPGEEHFQVSFFAKKSGEMYIVWIDLEDIEGGPPGITILGGYTTSINKDKFLCLWFIKKVYQDSADKQEKPMFMIAHYNISGKDILSINMFSQGAIKRMIEEGKLKGVIEKGKYVDKVLVTSSSDELVAAILKDGLESFILEDEVLKFQRIQNKH
jgi:hypothetical protein